MDTKKYFDYLNKLRDSGETNMYGAADCLRRRFPELSIDRKLASDVLLAWMKSFEEASE